MFQKTTRLTGLLTALLLLMPTLASAHVIVTPDSASVGQELVFNVSCPNERQNSIVKVTLQVPSGVSEVVPTAEPGWTISTTMSDSEVTAITWSGGQIPAGQREDFGFSAQVPGQATKIDWKAYQTYADGTVVHWDQKPAGRDDATGTAGPYSVTKVINDLAQPAAINTSNNNLPFILAIVSLALSAGAWLRSGKTSR